MSIAPGWYKDPAEPATQRYWDGEGWVGPALPADAEPPAGPPPARMTAPVQAPPAPPAQPEGGLPANNAAPAPAMPLPPGAQIPPEWVYPHRRAAPPTRPHGLPLASPGARLVARLIDIAIVGFLALLANGWFIYQLVGEAMPFFADAMERGPEAADPEAASRINTLLFVIPLVTMLVWLAYEVPALANTGQTLGKRTLGIKVMRLESGDKLGMGRSLRRFSTLGLPTMLWTCFGLGLILQLVDCLFLVLDQKMGQALHDRSAHTVVVHIGRPQGTPSSTPQSDGGQR